MRVTINTVAVGGVLAFLAYKAFRFFYWDRKPEMVTPQGLPVPMSVGKERSFHSLTRDASMFTLKTRRCAIQSGPRIFQKTGSSNGSTEAYFLSGVCSGPTCRSVNYIEDAGNAQTESCIILDGNGGEVLDFGNAATTVCNI